MSTVIIEHSAVTGSDRLGVILRDHGHKLNVIRPDNGDPIPTDLDGIDATREIKATYPLIEVILLTGHASMEASLKGMKLGAFDYLLKPVNIDELVYKIEDASRKKELQEEKIRRLQDQTDTAVGEQETTE